MDETEKGSLMGLFLRCIDMFMQTGSLQGSLRARAGVVARGEIRGLLEGGGAHSQGGRQAAVAEGSGSGRSLLTTSAELQAR